jgi:hypothetical protein
MACGVDCAQYYLECNSGKCAVKYGSPPSDAGTD